MAAEAVEVVAAAAARAAAASAVVAVSGQLREGTAAGMVEGTRGEEVAVRVAGAMVVEARVAAAWETVASRAGARVHYPEAKGVGQAVWRVVGQRVGTVAASRAEKKAVAAEAMAATGRALAEMEAAVEAEGVEVAMAAVGVAVAVWEEVQPEEG